MLKKITLAPFLNRENTQYASEGKWWESDKVRFRQGSPEKIGGWVRTSANTFLGICRLLFDWVTLASAKLTAVGTSTKFYISKGGAYYDITPVVNTTTAAATFVAVDGSTTVTVTDAGHGTTTGSYVTFTLAVSLGGNITATVLNAEYRVTVTGTNTYTITTAVAATAGDTGNGGAATVAKYQLPIGYDIAVPVTGWGGGRWGVGTWGVGTSSVAALRQWTAMNFGEDLVFGPVGGAMYYWDATNGVTTRAVLLSSLGGASDVPTVQNGIFVADISRFVFAFGCNDIGGSADPMCVRWSDQESAVDWTPTATNQAGSLKLSHGSKIVAIAQARQELLVFTDTSLYSLQYLGAPVVWGATLISDNVCCVSLNAIAVTPGGTYWMGVDKFYKYDGRAQTLRCDLWQYIFSDINTLQTDQAFSGTNDAFNEVWWFYCSANSTTIDRYVIYNYVDDGWCYGTMARTAWKDSGLYTTPVAATYSQNLVYHESGVDDDETGTPAAIEAYVASGEFDIDDGDRFALIYRALPDITFRGSTATNPAALLTLYPLKNSGSGYNSPTSVAGSNSATITRTATAPIEAFTGQVYIRVRGRQLIMKISSNALGVAWQLGGMRLDIKPDGRRG